MGEEETGQMIVHISGRTYPLKVKPGEESVISDVVGEVNDKVTELQSTYSSRDKQDCLSMALLTYAFKLKEAKSTVMDQHVSEKIDQLDSLLNEMLAK